MRRPMYSKAAADPSPGAAEPVAMTPLLLLAIVGLVVVNGFFVAAEFALVSVRTERLDGSRAGKLVARQVAKLDEYLSACQLGITIASLALGALGEPTIARLLEPALGVFADFGAVMATLLALLIMTALHITAGEQAPKSFAIGSAERVAGLCAYPLQWFYISLRPLVRILNRASNAIVRLFGGTPATSHGDQASLEELRLLIRAASETGKIDRGDSQLLRGVFTLDERTASDVMTPRHRLTTVATGQTIEEALRSTVRSRHSRFPLLAPDDELEGLVISREMTDELLEGSGGLAIESIRHPIVDRARRRSRWTWCLPACRSSARPCARWWTSTASSRASSPWRTSSRRSSVRSGTRTTRRAGYAGSPTAAWSPAATRRSSTSRTRASTSSRSTPSRSAASSRSTSATFRDPGIASPWAGGSSACSRPTGTASSACSSGRGETTAEPQMTLKSNGRSDR